MGSPLPSSFRTIGRSFSINLGQARWGTGSERISFAGDSSETPRDATVKK